MHRALLNYAGGVLRSQMKTFFNSYCFKAMYIHYEILSHLQIVQVQQLITEMLFGKFIGAKKYVLGFVGGTGPWYPIFLTFKISGLNTIKYRVCDLSVTIRAMAQISHQP